MVVDAMQLHGGNTVSALEEQRPHRIHTRHVFPIEGDPLSDLTGKVRWDASRRTRPHALVFLLCMAAISLVRQIADGLIGSALFEWFGLALDPIVLAVVLYLAATLIGIGVAGCFSKATPDAAAKRHLHLIVLAAMGIGLILVWLSHVVGSSDVLDWPLVVVYLLWAWVAAVSNAQVRGQADVSARTESSVRVRRP